MEKKSAEITLKEWPMAKIRSYLNIFRDDFINRMNIEM
jgi:hypothetical protein